MKEKWQTHVFILGLVGLLLLSCGPNKVKREWVASDVQVKPMNSVLVIGVGDNEKRKMMFEKTLARQLTLNGTAALTTRDVGLWGKLTREMVEEVVADRAIDGVLVGRLTGMDFKETTQLGAPTGVGGNDLYAVYEGNNVLVATSYVAETSLSQFTLQLETRLFDAQAGTLIWQLASDAVEQDSLQEMVNTFSEFLVQNLTRRGFLKPKP